MNALDQVLASFPLTSWLVLVELALVRTAVAGLFCGKWWWFRPTTRRPWAVEPTASLREDRFRRRRLVLVLAVAFGWLPGLLVDSVVGSSDQTINGAIVVASFASLLIYFVWSLRRYDRQAIGSQ